MRRHCSERAALALVLLLTACGRPRDTIFEGYAFVAVAGDPSLAVVDLASFTVRRRIPLAGRPGGLASDSGRRAVYVWGEWGVTRIHAAALEIAGTSRQKDAPYRLRLRPGGRAVYVLNRHSLLTLDPDTLAERWRLPLPAEPLDFDFSPDERLACVTLRSGEAAIVDLEHGRATARIALGGEPALVAVRHDGRQAFVADRLDRSLTALDLTAGRLVTRLPLNTRPEALGFKPDGGELFVSGGDTGTVLIVSAYRDEVDQPLLAGAEPRDLAFSSDNRMLYVANSGANTVSAVDIEQRRTVAAVPVGEEPRRVVLTPDHQYVLVLNRRSGDLAVIRRRIVEGPREPIRPLFTMIPVGAEPVDLAVQAR